MTVSYISITHSANFGNNFRIQAGSALLALCEGPGLSTLPPAGGESPLGLHCPPPDRAVLLPAHGCHPGGGSLSATHRQLHLATFPPPAPGCPFSLVEVNQAIK